ncbi:hypothetical protein TB1_033578 [Malus domestica]
MPCTTTLECPGCPPLRALPSTSLVSSKLLKHGVSKECQTVLATSLDDRKLDPLLAEDDPVTGLHLLAKKEFGIGFKVFHFAYMYSKRKC